MTSALTAAQYGVGALVTAVFHPIGYAKVLIQIGHEPIPAYPTKNIFGKDAMIYPNVFKYLKHIKATDGFFGLYRGVVPRTLGGVLATTVQSHVHNHLKRFNPEEEIDTFNQDDEFVKWMKTFCRQTGEETLCKCIGIVASQPFHVIMMRCMVQFVGREEQYNSIYSSIGEIYRNDGILGFFSGLVPRLIGEIITLWMTNFIAHLINKYLIEDKEMKRYTSAACGLVVTQFTYPFQLVGNIMTINNSGLAASRPPYMSKYLNWTDCWDHLRKMGQLKRGSSLFWRYRSGPVYRSY